MATRNEIRVVHVAGVVQGIALVTFPAAGTVFTNPRYYNLTSAQYGILFLPQVIAAITASVLGADLSKRLGTKRVYLAGLAADLLSMALLIVSSLLTSNKPLAYGLLLSATASLGTGFGLAVPALNTLAAALSPARVDRSILVLNALLGLGTVLAPVFVVLFVGVGFWQGLPLTSASLLVALLVASLRLPLRVQAAASPATATKPDRRTAAIPPRFWVYAGFAVLYGICETVSGNWSQLDMTRELGASTTVASLALTAFWAMVTAGRVLFAEVQRWLPPRLIYHFLPFLLAGAFVIVAVLPHGEVGLGVLAFGLAGVGCSALLPLTISFGQEELTGFATRVAGGVIAFYQVGYGIAAFAVGPLVDGGVRLSTIYGGAAVVAALMGACSVPLARRRPSPAAWFPHLGHTAMNADQAEV
ncbi:MAG TPA: MFS transporter [Solirubrobacteraceae bacterium]|nr:MFS transporter [Solirubrobacteraceae bacterium]